MPDTHAAAIEPFDTRTLEVDPPHQLYVEQVGNPKGLPAVFLHGGPGGGCQPHQRRLFDPRRFRTVFYDQRGAGRSRPKRCLEANTTAHLIADLETIRRSLGIERWMVVGGSWGSLLGTAYAQAHPERVSGLVLRAVFLGTPEEVDWALIRGPQIFYPDLWRGLLALLPEDERAAPLAALGRRLEAPDPAVHGPAAWVWHDYERTLSILRPGGLALPRSLDGNSPVRRPLPDSPFVEWHYFRSDCFLEPNQLIKGASRLRGIPGAIVQGRYDLLCPPETARALADTWPDARLTFVEGAGHALGEPVVWRGLGAAINDLARELG